MKSFKERCRMCRGLFVILTSLPLVAVAEPGRRKERPFTSWTGSNLDHKLHFTVHTDSQGRLRYQIVKLVSGSEKVTVIERSPLGITVDGVDLGRGPYLLDGVTGATRAEEYPWRGVHSPASTVQCERLLMLTHSRSKKKLDLQVRLFTDAVAFCYASPEGTSHLVSGEATAFTFPEKTTLWFQRNRANYEGIYENSDCAALKKGTPMGPPVVAVFGQEKLFAAITEARAFGASGMILKAKGEGSRRLEAAFAQQSSWRSDGQILTPYRVVLVAESLNELVNTDAIHTLCQPPDEALARAPWIMPGRAVWSWWSQGTGDPKLNMHYVDCAAQLGFEYNLVDAGWERWRQGQKSPWDLIAELVEYARKKGVRIWVWKHCRGIRERKARREFFKRCRAAGVAGVKIDFMDSEAKPVLDFYVDALQDAGDYHLMVNFHGANKPTGLSRTFPNEMTREAVRGLEYNKWSALPPRHYAVLPFTRYVAGHGDFTPCTFDPARLKGTTAALQLASAVLFTSPLTHWADRPERYLESCARDVIETLPTVWDETVVLPESKLGTLAACVRRTGDRYFAGVINAGSQRPFTLDLSFLPEGLWNCVYLKDDLRHPERMIRSEHKLRRTADAAPRIPVTLAHGGGLVARFIPDAQKELWRLTFQDEFDGDRLQRTKWNLQDPWGRERNRELQAYVPDAFQIQKGVLRITARKAQAMYDGKLRSYTSGMMTTYRLFSQKFGWFEIRCRVPKGKGLWPAFWLLPEPLRWPPEIDVLEILGHHTTKVYFTHHWRDKFGVHRSHGGHFTGPLFGETFHVFALKWEPDRLTWYVDGKERFRSKRSVPATYPMYLLLNLAVGGTWPGAPNEDTPFPAAFEIDYVRVYQRTGAPPNPAKGD